MESKENVLHIIKGYFGLRATRSNMDAIATWLPINIIKSDDREAKHCQ
jgi:hypothetical protein